jgi:hypothetical protein
VKGLLAALLLVAVSGAFLCLDLAADPPLTLSPASPFCEEGEYTHGAKALLTEGTPHTDEWRDYLLTPVTSGLTWIVFRLRGAGLESARIVPVALAILSQVLFFLILRRSYPTPVALLATLLLSVSYLHLMFGRLALRAPGHVFFLLLTIWLWGFGRRHEAFYFLAGMAAFVASIAEMPAAGFFFAFTSGLALLLIRIHAIKMPWGPRVSRIAGHFLRGFAVALLLWGFFWFLPRRAGFFRMLALVWPVPHAPSAMARNVFISPYAMAPLVSAILPVFVVVVLYVLFFTKDLMKRIARHMELGEEKVWMWSWLATGLLYVAAMTSRPLPSLLILLPPLLAVAADGIFRLASLGRIERPRVDYTVLLALESLVVWFLVQWGVAEWLSRNVRSLPPWFVVHHFRWELALIVAIALPIAAAIGWIFWKWRRWSVRVPAPLARTAAAALVLAIVATDLARTAAWHRTRAHTVANAIEGMSGIEGRMVVAGSWAPLLTLGSAHLGIPFRPGLNDRDVLLRMRLTHLLVQRGSNEDPRANHPLRAGDPLLEEHVRLTRSFPVGDRTVDLYELTRGEPPDSTERLADGAAPR